MLVQELGTSHAEVEGASALKRSRSSCAPENGEGAETLGGFGGGGGAALGWAGAGGGDRLRRASWAWRAVIWAVVGGKMVQYMGRL